MSRLTKKLTTNSNYEIQLLQLGLNYISNTPYNEQVIHKLGKLEDLEQELDIDLDILIKACINGYIYVLNEDKELEKYNIEFEMNNPFTEKVLTIYIDYVEDDHGGYPIFKDLALKDYKKTWWLSSDLEE